MEYKILDWFFEHIAGWLVVGGIAVALFGLLALPFLIYADSKQPKFEINKSEFSCSLQHDEQTTYYIQQNGMTLPQTSYYTVCDQYSRVAR